MRRITGDASTNLITSEVVHGLQVGEPVEVVQLAGGAGLTGRALGRSNIPPKYFVIASGLTARAFKISTSVGGSAVDFTTNITAGFWRRFNPGGKAR